MDIISREEAQAVQESMSTADRLCYSENSTKSAHGLTELRALIQKYPYSVPLLVRAAQLIMMDDRCNGNMAKVRACFEAARILDPDNVDCLYEFAQFVYTIEDNLDEAQLLFDTLFQLGKHAMREGVRGMAHCLHEKGHLSQAKSLLSSYEHLFDPSEDEYQSLLNEITDDERKMNS